VTIRRGGDDETLYLDQSEQAPAASRSLATPAPDPFAAIRAAGTAVPPLIADISAEPRMRGGRIDGYVLQPGANGTAFAAAGLRRGDVLLAIAGKRVGDGVGLERLAGGGGPVEIQVERDGAAVTLTVGGAR
jgi:general secretion pathway protein C